MGTELVHNTDLQMLCPQSMPPLNMAHHARVDSLNRAYGAIDLDADDEMDPAQEKVYEALAGTGDWMRLYIGTDIAMVRNQLFTIRTAFWRCLTCGFTLAATMEPYQR